MLDMNFTLTRLFLVCWFIVVPFVLLGLWVFQVGPASDWGWSVVTAPLWMGAAIIVLGWTAGIIDPTEF